MMGWKNVLCNLRLVNLVKKLRRLCGKISFVVKQKISNFSKLKNPGSPHENFILG